MHNIIAYTVLLTVDHVLELGGELKRLAEEFPEKCIVRNLFVTALLVQERLCGSVSGSIGEI